MDEKEQAVQHFLNLIQKSRRGKFKVYIGMSAGVGKSYRMLQEAHALLRNGIDVRIGYIETHGRRETVELVKGLPQIARKQVFYKGKMIEEMDVPAILAQRPELVIVDELAHTNVEGSKNEKRWQDVMDILDAGINVISALNIQHIESLNEEVREISGIDVAERVPDRVLREADEVINIDLSAEELISRLKDGKIYSPDKIQRALQNFFKEDNILQLRELALKEVASQVERKVETQVPRNAGLRHERFMACISSNEVAAKSIIRKTARLASYYNSQWFVLYVQLPREAPDRIASDKQRFLLNNFKLATQLGGEILRVQHSSIPRAIVEQAEMRNVTTICIGRPSLKLFQLISRSSVFVRLMKKLYSRDIDLIVLSS